MSALANSRIDLRQQKNPFRSGLCEIRSGAIQTPLLQVCLCATFVDASLDAVLPGFGGLYLCLIRQPSKQNLAFNLYGRRKLDLFSKPSSQDFHLSISLNFFCATLEDEGPNEDQKYNCRRAEQD